jgi:hypothetical protein
MPDTRMDWHRLISLVSHLVFLWVSGRRISWSRSSIQFLARQVTTHRISIIFLSFRFLENAMGLIQPHALAFYYQNHV